MTDGLVAFLRGRLDEDEHTARAASGNQWLSDAGDSPADAWILNEDMHLAEVDPPTAEHIARNDPARVLAEVDVKRRMLDYLADLERKALDGNWWNLDTSQPLKLLALPYADHPDYRPEWAPEA